MTFPSDEAKTKRPCKGLVVYSLVVEDSGFLVQNPVHDNKGNDRDDVQRDSTNDNLHEGLGVRVRVLPGFQHDDPSIGVSLYPL